MAKIYGLFGAMTGKLADTVMAVRNGEQIARRYQPIVSNPGTPAQIAVRAKMKLMSQLSANMAPYIAIPREGAVSSRNIFTKVNFQLAGYTNNAASIDLNKVQLTQSAVGIPNVVVSREAEKVLAYINSSVETGFSRVVYVAFIKGDNDSLIPAGSVIVEKSSDTTFNTQDIPFTTASLLVLAYGIRDNNNNATTIFGNLTAPSAEDVAKLITTRTIGTSDITMSKTVGATLAAATTHSVTALDDMVRSSKKN